MLDYSSLAGLCWFVFAIKLGGGDSSAFGSVDPATQALAVNMAITVTRKEQVFPKI